MEHFDVIIIGAGPAGCTAAMYCGRSELKTLMLEKLSPGGQMATTAEIENYPGFPNGVNGAELAFSMLEQAQRFGVQLKYEEVLSIELEGDEKQISLNGGEKVGAKCLILAMGAAPRLLGVPGEDKLRGRGVSYCATCDGAFFKGKTVAVIGGGDTAAADALFLSSICKKVYLIHRRDSLRAAKLYHTRLKAAETVEFMWDSTVTEIHGDNRLEAISVKSLKTQEQQRLNIDGVFIAVGNEPGTELVKELVTLDKGYIAAGEDTKTSCPGVFACGDCRKKPLRQVVTAVADGGVAAHMAQEYLY